MKSYDIDVNNLAYQLDILHLLVGAEGDKESWTEEESEVAAGMTRVTGNLFRDALGRWSSGAGGAVEKVKETASEVQQTVQENAEKFAEEVKKDSEAFIKNVSEFHERVDAEFEKLKTEKRQQVMDSFAAAVEKAHVDLSQKIQGAQNIVQGFKEAKMPNVASMSKPLQDSFSHMTQAVSEAVRELPEHTKELKMGAMLAATIPYFVLTGQALAKAKLDPVRTGIELGLLTISMGSLGGTVVGGVAALGVMKLEQVAISMLLKQLAKKAVVAQAESILKGSATTAFNALNIAGSMVYAINLLNMVRNVRFLTDKNFAREKKDAMMDTAKDINMALLGPVVKKLGKKKPPVEFKEKMADPEPLPDAPVGSEASSI